MTAKSQGFYYNLCYSSTVNSVKFPCQLIGLGLVQKINGVHDRVPHGGDGRFQHLRAAVPERAEDPSATRAKIKIFAVHEPPLGHRKS